MGYFQKIDKLLLFFVLSLSVLLVSSQYVKDAVLPAETINDQFKDDFSISDAISVSSELDPNATIKSYNPENQILYSTDGGDTYLEKCGDEIHLSSVRNTDLLRYPTSIRWRGPRGTFPEGLSVRIKLKNQNSGKISTPKVINSFNSRGCNSRVACISISQNDLFEWSEGLMIYGQKSSVDDGFHKAWWYRSANFSERGMDWERSANFQYFVDRELVLDQDVGFRISGNASRYFPQKSFKLYARNVYGSSKLDFRFWGKLGNKKSKTLLFRNSGNDNEKSMFADVFIHEIVRDCNVLTQNSVPITVFINGIYWGIYNLRERMDSYCVSKKARVKESNVTILYCEVNGNESILRAGKEIDKQNFDRLISQLNAHSEKVEENYNALDENIDLESFTDYIILESFFANNDWLSNNTVWYKAGEQKWKWMMNDMDCSMAYPGSDHVNINIFDHIIATNSITSSLFTCLVKNKNYLSNFKKRGYELLGGILAEDNLSEVFYSTKRLYEPYIGIQIRRWRMIKSYERWDENCSDNLEFLLKRRQIFRSQIQNLK